jgi:hypothetical protein
MRIIFSLLCLISSSVLLAQDIRYEQLDQFSKEISKYQADVNGKTYLGATIGFSQNNFNVYFYNLRCDYAIYKTTSSGEELNVVENIDMTAATGVTVKKNGDVGRVHVEFPAGSLRVQVFKNGEPAGTEIASGLDFYCEASARGELYKKLIRLHYYLRKKTEPNAKDDVELLENDWIAALNSNKRSAYEAFISKHPGTLYETQARAELETLKQKEEEDKKRREKERQEEEKRLAKIKAEEERKKEEQRRAARDRHNKEADHYNKREYFNLGIQSGEIGKYGIAWESGGATSIFGFRMSVRGSFISGDVVMDKKRVYKLTDTKEGRFTLSLGPSIRIVPALVLWGGIGYGTYNVWGNYTVYDSKGRYLADERYVIEGDDDFFFESSFGAMLRLGRVVCLNGGYSFRNLGHPELTFGLTFNVTPKMQKMK